MTAPDERWSGLVIAPARPRSGSGAGLAFEMRMLAGGGLGLPVFSSVAGLVGVLGRYQPWVCVPLAVAEEAVRQAGAGRVVLDPGADSSAWRWSEAGLEGLGVAAAGQGGTPW
jgi:hypothetical protein